MEEQTQEPSAHHRHHGRHFANRPVERYGQGTPVRQQPMARPTQVFRAPPLPVRPAPYHLTLHTVLSPQQMSLIHSTGRLIFHTIGDTGGVKSPEPQHIVAMHMEQDFAAPDTSTHLAFLYHLGDEVTISPYRVRNSPGALRLYCTILLLSILSNISYYNKNLLYIFLIVG